MEDGHHAWHTAGTQQLSPPLPSSRLSSQTRLADLGSLPMNQSCPSAHGVCPQKTKSSSSSPATEDSYRLSPTHVSMWKAQKMTLPFKILSTS